MRIREQLRKHRLLTVDVRGVDHVRELAGKGHGVLITPNHAGHADCFALYAAADQAETPFYVMVAWQVFQRGGRLGPAKQAIGEMASQDPGQEDSHDLCHK